MNKEAQRAIDRAQVQLIINQPFFGNLLCNMPIEEAPIPTMAVSYTKILYSPDYVLRQPSVLVESTLCHEILHVSLEHVDRKGVRDDFIWNVAADYVVNLILQQSGITIGKDWLIDQRFANMSVEAVYDQPINESPKNKPLDQIINEGQGGGEKNESARVEWKLAVVAAATEARKAGKLPAALDRFITDLLGGKPDWKNALWRFAQETSKNDYSWLRPNRRMMNYGITLPSLHDVGIGTMVIVIDTSGSIQGPILNAFASETQAVREQVRPRETYVLYCDAEIGKVDRFDAEDSLVFNPVGGGGTDFRPPFEWLKARDITPACLLYLTDMYGTFPDAPPHYPTLWVKTTDAHAPWGEEVRISV